MIAAPERRNLRSEGEGERNSKTGSVGGDTQNKSEGGMRGKCISELWVRRQQREVREWRRGVEKGER